MAVPESAPGLGDSVLGLSGQRAEHLAGFVGRNSKAFPRSALRFPAPENRFFFFFFHSSPDSFGTAVPIHDL